LIERIRNVREEEEEEENIFIFNWQDTKSNTFVICFSTCMI